MQGCARFWAGDPQRTRGSLLFPYCRVVHRCGEEILKGELPPKHEVVLKLALTPTQQKVYERYLQVGRQRRGSRRAVSDAHWLVIMQYTDGFQAGEHANPGSSGTSTCPLPRLQGTAEHEARSLFRDRLLLAMVRLALLGACLECMHGLSHAACVLRAVCSSRAVLHSETKPALQTNTSPTAVRPAV